MNNAELNLKVIEDLKQFCNINIKKLVKQYYIKKALPKLSSLQYEISSTETKLKATIFLAGDQLLIDTTQTTVTITLPAAPAIGDEIVIIDARGTFGSNNVTVNRNGKPINSGTNNLALATNGQAITLVFIDSTRGWSFKTNTA